MPMTQKEVNALTPGDRVRWEYTGPPVEDADTPMEMEVGDSQMPGCVLLMWDDGTLTECERTHVGFWQYATKLPDQKKD